MTTLAEAHGVEVTKERMQIYENALSDLSLDDLDGAFQSALKTCTRFPSIAEIRQQATKRAESVDSFEAEKSWALVQSIVRKHWCGELMPIMASKAPDDWPGRVQPYNGGFLLHPPDLDAAADYAVRLVGGLGRIAAATGDKELDFIRRDFLVAHKRHRETAGLLAPSREEAAGLLEKLKTQQIAAGEA